MFNLSKPLRKSTCSKKMDKLFISPHQRVLTPRSRGRNFTSVLLVQADVLVHASVPANTFAIYGHGEEKELTELVPGILNQLGADSLATLRQLAESLQQKQGSEGAAGGDKTAEDDDDDDDVPDLVENFEDAEKQD